MARKTRASKSTKASEDEAPSNVDDQVNKAGIEIEIEIETETEEDTKASATATATATAASGGAVAEEEPKTDHAVEEDSAKAKDTDKDMGKVTAEANEDAADTKDESKAEDTATDKMDVDVDVDVDVDGAKKDDTDEKKTEESKEGGEDAKKDEASKTEAEGNAKKDEPAEAAAAAAAADTKSEDDDPRPAIWAPNDPDVLSGRGACVNAHAGNKKFRALCFVRKPMFEAGNHAAKRRIATEIVVTTYNDGQARFLKKKQDKGPWYEMTREQAILKACQVMRDYKRPDRLAIREMMAQSGQARKRSRHTESTPLADVLTPTVPVDPIIENPFGVQDHDILCGRGAFVNGHIGNQRLRTLAQARKIAFDTGNYTEKRSLASEIVGAIKGLDPPGRFLKRAKDDEKGTATDQKTLKTEPAPVIDTWVLPIKGADGDWEELNDEKAIHKACQVMRDIDRPDRKDREERRARKKQRIVDLKTGKLPTAAEALAHAAALSESASQKKDDTEAATITKEKKDESKKEDATTTAAVAEAVAATEEALDKALDAAGSTKGAASKEDINKAKEESVEI